MTMTIRPVSTMEFIGLSETNTIGYYIANEITTTYHGMMIAIPEPEWDVFYSMSTADLAAILVELAQGVRLQAFRKSPRRPKKPHPQGKKPARKGHVSTAKLLMNRKANLVTP